MYSIKVLTKVILKVTSCNFRQDNVDKGQTIRYPGRGAEKFSLQEFFLVGSFVGTFFIAVGKIDISKCARITVQEFFLKGLKNREKLATVLCSKKTILTLNFISEQSSKCLYITKIVIYTR